MHYPWRVLGAVMLATVVLSGCDPGGVKVQTYEIKTPSALDQAKQTVQRYANGAPLGSEVTGFPQLVERVKANDPEKAAILEKGLAELQEARSGRAEKAKALLKQL